MKDQQEKEDAMSVRNSFSEVSRTLGVG